MGKGSWRGYDLRKGLALPGWSCHPIGVEITAGTTPEGVSPSVSVNVTDTELRPSLIKDYSARTLKCYEDRLLHYQRWCAQQRLQGAAGQITTAKLLAYVRGQIDRWNNGEDPDAPADPEFRMLRPETLRQGMNALVYYGERSAPEAPDNREAREAIRLFRKQFDATHAPAWRVTGRKSPRRRRDQPVARPSMARSVQGELFADLSA